MFCNGLNDRSFDAWANDEECIKPAKSGFNSPMTVDSDVKQHLMHPAGDKENCYLLVKNFPSDISEKEVWSLFQDCVFLEKVFILSKINNVYMKFTSMIEMQSLINTNELEPMVYKGQKLKMCSVLKLPLDLNSGSKVLLLTIYDEKIEITAQAIYQIFKDSFRPVRIIIFKKKNYQSFIEFQSVEEACEFKNHFDNMNFKGFFFLKVQFTKKNSINISKNSAMEHDFTLAQDLKVKMQTIDFNFEEHPKRFSISKQSNVVPSFQNFDDWTETGVKPQESKEYFPDVTMDTSEDKTEYFYILNISNLNPDVKHKALFNLFSLYGNIEKISVDTSARKATIFYLSEFEQMTAHHCLVGLVLFSCALAIEPSKVTRTTQKSSQYPNLVYYKKNNETRQVTPISKLRVINKPLSVLYVFNLSPNAPLDIVKNLFDLYAPVVSINYSNETKNSALVFFKTVEDAAKILCLFKNTNLIDKSLKINFANGNLLKGKEQIQERRKSKFISLQNFNQCATFLDFDAPVIEQKKNRLDGQSSAFKLMRQPFCG